MLSWLRVSDDQLESVLRAMAETFYPPTPEDQVSAYIDSHVLLKIPRTKQVNTKTLTEYFTYAVHRDSDLIPFMTERMALVMRGVELLAVRLMLWTLSTWWGTMLLSFGKFYQPFTELSIHDREKIMLRGWLGGWVTPLKVLCRLMHALINYTCPDAAKHSQKTMENEILSKHMLKISSDSEIDSFDVVIVGSGAGGGVAAANLSAAGFKVLVCEKGEYNRAPTLSSFEEVGYSKMYENRGLLATPCGSALFLAGSTLGGGTTVNWSASLDLPDHARAEWADKFGLPDLAGDKFSKSLSAVKKRMGVHSEHTQNKSNQILLDGCEKIGLVGDVIPQNTHKDHDCGSFCALGCLSSGKQGSMETFLIDACSNGAQILCGCLVNSISHDNGRLSHIDATVDSIHRVGIHAKCVIVSGGSINTPALLLRSGFKNPNIGKNLKIHPVSTAVGYFPGQEIRPYNGSIMTAIAKCKDAAGKKEYGAALEVPTALPMIVSCVIPYFRRLQDTTAGSRREFMLKLNNLVPLIILQRDMDSVGSISIDPNDGSPMIKYTLSKHDGDSMTVAVVQALDLLVAQGATEVFTLIDTEPKFEFCADKESMSSTKSSPSRENAGYLDFILRIKKARIDPPRNCLTSSAHQMGSCRMGPDAKTSACSSKGQLWECSDVWICDASVFPTASGVNPMLTVMTCADIISKHCIEWLKNKK